MGQWERAGGLDRYRDGRLQGALVAGKRLCIGREGDRFFALDDTCPHAGGSLSEGIVDGGLVICPLHAYGFEVDTGHCDDDPSCSVNAYAVRVEGDGVWVDVGPAE